MLRGDALRAVLASTLGISDLCSIAMAVALHQKYLGFPISLSIPCTACAAMYGPTTGDRLRLGDSDLIIEVESDLTTYGEEVKFGGGKMIRDGMGQSQTTRAGGACEIRPSGGQQGRSGTA